MNEVDLPWLCEGRVALFRRISFSMWVVCACGCVCLCVCACVGRQTLSTHVHYADMRVELRSHLGRINASYDVALAAHGCVHVCCAHGRMFTWASLSQCHDAIIAFLILVTSLCCVLASCASLRYHR